MSTSPREPTSPTLARPKTSSSSVRRSLPGVPPAGHGPSNSIRRSLSPTPSRKGKTSSTDDQLNNNNDNDTLSVSSTTTTTSSNPPKSPIPTRTRSAPVTRPAKKLPIPTIFTQQQGHPPTSPKFPRARPKTTSSTTTNRHLPQQQQPQPQQQAGQGLLVKQRSGDAPHRSTVSLDRQSHYSYESDFESVTPSEAYDDDVLLVDQDDSELGTPLSEVSQEMNEDMTSSDPTESASQPPLLLNSSDFDNVEMTTFEGSFELIVPPPQEKKLEKLMAKRDNDDEDSSQLEEKAEIQLDFDPFAPAPSVPIVAARLSSPPKTETKTQLLSNPFNSSRADPKPKSFISDKTLSTDSQPPSPFLPSFSSLNENTSFLNAKKGSTKQNASDVTKKPRPRQTLTFASPVGTSRSSRKLQIEATKLEAFQRIISHVKANPHENHKVTSNFILMELARFAMRLDPILHPT